jgi:RNA polymerase sigma factor (sigma-70 family)
LLSTALSHYLDIHARRHGRVSLEECEDIVAQKALDLLQRALDGAWDQTGRSAGEVARFLSTVARNGLLDCLQEQRRLPRLNLDPGRDGEPAVACVHLSSREEDPDRQLQRKEFAGALRRCAEKLKPRSRRVWFFRVFYAMSSKEIASHPEIGMSCNHIDVILLRARKLILDCMRHKGYEPQDMLPGTFVELWTAFRVQDLQTVRGCHE